MRRLMVLAGASMVVGTVLVSPGGAAPAPGLPAEDFVVGSGQGPTTCFNDIVIDAHSDPNGGNPTGSVSMEWGCAGQTPPPTLTGPVNCLAVTGNTAVIGFIDMGTNHYGHLATQIIDNGSVGDQFGGLVGIAGFVTCHTADLDFGPEPIRNGNFVVHDAPPLTSKDQCKHGGWRNFTDDAGQPFKNQGQCVLFIVRASPAP
jgi:hypothetical protein